MKDGQIFIGLRLASMGIVWSSRSSGCIGDLRLCRKILGGLCLGLNCKGMNVGKGMLGMGCRFGGLGLKAVFVIYVFFVFACLSLGNS